MFGIGFVELAVIAVVAIVFVGPKKLPEMMKHVGKFFVQARRMSNEVRSTFDTVIKDAERELHLDNINKIKELTKGSLSLDPQHTEDNDDHHNDDHHNDDHHNDDHHQENENESTSAHVPEDSQSRPQQTEASATAAKIKDTDDQVPSFDDNDEARGKLTK